MRRLFVACVLLGLAGTAAAQSFSQRGYERVIDGADVLLTPRRSLKCGTGLTCTDDPGNERTVITATGGAGGGTTGMIGMATCMPITGAVTPLFMSAGSCVEQTEVRASEHVANAMIFEDLACVASADLGSGKTVTVTGRSGSCGSLASASFTCVLTGGVSQPICNAGASTFSVSAGQCWSLQVVSSTTLDNAVRVNCTMERTS